jgi:hypothetical protein
MDPQESITDNTYVVENGIATETKLDALVPKTSSGGVTMWANYHKSAWQNHVLVWVKSRGFTEEDLTTADNLKYMTAVKAVILAAQARGNITPDTQDALWLKGLRDDYAEQTRIVELKTNRGTEPASPGWMTRARGS